MIDNRHNIRLIDFGISFILDSEHMVMKTACGSPVYMPPEILEKSLYTEKCDIWSAGILLYYMLSGRFPFYDQNRFKLFERIKTEELHLPTSFPSDLCDLLYKMLEKNPSQRFSISEVLHHPFITGSSVHHDLSYTLDRCLNPAIIEKSVKAKIAENSKGKTGNQDNLFGGSNFDYQIVYRIFEKEIITEMFNESKELANTGRPSSLPKLFIPESKKSRFNMPLNSSIRTNNLPRQNVLLPQISSRKLGVQLRQPYLLNRGFTAFDSTGGMK